jgi:hypothetical protein
MYVDLETMEKKQGTVFIWLLTNVFDEQPFKSIASRMEYDCKQKRGKVHQEYRYSEHFMGGTNVSPNPGVAGEWYYAAPGTVAMNIINTLCKK